MLSPWGLTTEAGQLAAEDAAEKPRLAEAASRLPVPATKPMLPKRRWRMRLPAAGRQNASRKTCHGAGRTCNISVIAPRPPGGD